MYSIQIYYDHFTATTGTGGSVGLIQKQIGSLYDYVISFSLTQDSVYKYGITKRVMSIDNSSWNYTFWVQNVNSNAWASGVSVTINYYRIHLYTS